MDDPLKPQRTWLCTVLFLDIVSYSSQSVELQMAWKKRFNDYLKQAIQDVLEKDRVILDTGDGAAICYLGDPEASLFCALKLQDCFAREAAELKPGLQVRIGINLGSVKLVRDINGNLNAIGDGINVAQRVMSFAGPNCILVSRSFFEAVSCLSEDYGRLFRYEGIRKDKHVREHAVYSVTPLGTGILPTEPPPASGLSEQTRANSGSVDECGLDGATLHALETALAMTLGPLAGHLVRNAARRCANVSELCSLLAAHVPDPTGRAAFLLRCQALLPQPEMAPAATSVKVQSAESDKVVTQGWDPAVLDTARVALASFIGPMAKIMVQRAAGRVQNARELYEILSELIPSPHDRKKFLASVQGT